MATRPNLLKQGRASPSQPTCDQQQGNPANWAPGKGVGAIFFTAEWAPGRGATLLLCGRQELERVPTWPGYTPAVLSASPPDSAEPLAAFYCPLPAPGTWQMPLSKAPYSPNICSPSAERSRVPVMPVIYITSDLYGTSQDGKVHEFTAFMNTTMSYVNKWFNFSEDNWLFHLQPLSLTSGKISYDDVEKITERLYLVGSLKSLWMSYMMSVLLPTAF
ncbi:unnamed protein product [Pleuronectes platessa]|uniref:Uncharacterized protein n=1 Tax=Pleuronectes platessa TaxID=8262 RepID=A0A9N7TX02_PLEPL|nr:unnamed protein product [Pleuronectes platessa]